MVSENDRNGFVDLHIHTGFSDGAHGTPANVAKRAKHLGLRAVAITEHDNLDSYPFSYKAFKEVGIPLIPGIEITTHNPKRAISYHILAYMFDPNNEALHSFLTESRQVFQHNLRQTLVGLNAMGYNTEWEELVDATLTKYSYLPKPEAHLPDIYVLSELMVKKEYAPSTPIADQIRREALRLARNVHQYPTQEVVFEAVKNAGGLVVLAHPQGFIQEHFAAEHLLKELVAEGLDGVEIHTPKHPPERRQYYSRLVDSVGCIGTGGSDCHDTRPNISICSLGRAQVPYKVIPAMIKRHRLKYGTRAPTG